MLATRQEQLQVIHAKALATLDEADRRTAELTTLESNIQAMDALLKASFSNLLFFPD